VSVAGFVLAGGRSRRMGRDKALLPYGDATLLEHALATLRDVCDDVVIAGSRDDLSAFAPVIADEFVECGPLGGMHAALAQSQLDWNLFLAVDMPRVTAEHLHKLLAQPRSVSTRAVFAQAGGRLQPLCGLYHRELAGKMAQALAEGKRAVIPVLESITDAHGLLRVDFEDAAAFLNMNTPEDMATLGVNEPST